MESLTSSNNAATNTNHRFFALAGEEDSAGLLIGDVNLFLSDFDAEEDEEDGTVSAREGNYVVGEIELMIAELSQQSKGYGKLAVLIFIIYVLNHKNAIVNQAEPVTSASSTLSNPRKQLKHLRVKIGKDNTRSIGLFEKLGFVKTTTDPNYFGEWELRMEFEHEEKVMERLTEMLSKAGVGWMTEAEYRRDKK